MNPGTTRAAPMWPASVPRTDVEGILARPLVEEDADSWYAYLSNPDVIRHTSWDLSGMDLRALIAGFAQGGSGASIRYALVEEASRALIGTVGLNGISLAHHQAEIAYDLAPAFWGKGIMSRVCRATALWAFSELKLVRVQACVLDTNLRSIRVLEKSGFGREGLLRDFRHVQGAPRDFWMYALLAREVAGS